MRNFNTEEEFKKSLHLFLREIINNYGDFKDQENIENLEFREIGLDSMAVVGIFLELESEGWIEISQIDNDSPPNTIIDILNLGVKSYKSSIYEKN